MAKVTGPLFSLSASGTVGKVVTYGTWKGICWAREWFKPSNPQSEAQTYLRNAWSLAVAYYKGTMTEEQKTAYDVGAEGTAKSGFNLYMQGMIDAYIDDPGIEVEPTECTNTGNYPDSVIEWNPV